MEEGANVPKHLWAPWRAEYFRMPKRDGCIFCEKAARLGPDGAAAGDEENLVLLRDKVGFALLNTFPYTGGHLMVAPYRHTAKLDDLIRRRLALPLEQRMNFLRRRLPGGGSCL